MQNQLDSIPELSVSVSNGEEEGKKLTSGDKLIPEDKPPTLCYEKSKAISVTAEERRHYSQLKPEKWKIFTSVLDSNCLGYDRWHS